MPTARIDTPGVTVELTANEASIEALGKQAMDMFREATDINNGTPVGVGFGIHNDRRGEPTVGYGTEWHQATPRQEKS